MEKEVIALVLQLQDIVRKQTKSKYPDVNNAVTSLQDYVKDWTASIPGIENKLKDLEDCLSRKSEKKKLCTDHIEKIRQAMRLRRKKTPKGTKSADKKRKTSSPTTSERSTPLLSQRKQHKTLRFELTQKDETTELLGTIDQNEEDYSLVLDIASLRLDQEELFIIYLEKNMCS